MKRHFLLFLLCLTALAVLSLFRPRLDIAPLTAHLLEDVPPPAPADREERDRLREEAIGLARSRDEAFARKDWAEVDRLDTRLTDNFLRMSRVNRQLGTDGGR